MYTDNFISRKLLERKESNKNLKYKQERRKKETINGIYRRQIVR